MRNGVRFSLVGFLCAVLLSTMCPAVALGKKTPRRQMSEARFLRHAERVLAAWRLATRLPQRRINIAEGVYELEQELRAWVRRNPSSGWAYLLLGKCELEQANYIAAVAAFKAASSLPGGGAPARAQLAQAQNLRRAVQAAKPHLPSGNEVIQVEEISSASHRLWVVLSAKWSRKMGELERYSNAHLNVIGKNGDSARVLWQSPRLAADRFGEDECNETSLVVLHQRGLSVPHIALAQTVQGGSWAPSHLSVFGWDGMQLRKLLGVNADDRLWIDDIDGNGRREIGASHAIGYGLSHAEMPYWTDIYAWNGHTYVLANERFPWRFREVTCSLRTALRKYPDDHELLKYQGILEEIKGRPSAAMRHLRLAERSCKAELVTLEFPDLRPRVTWELNDIRSRIARLVAGQAAR